MEGHALVGVGPGLHGARLRPGLVTGYPFPITGTKIHPPLLRADTLSRPRLNDWMDVAVRGRVVLVIAEAGFGKTTMLGDWASKSERRTAWYRLEPDDADWLVFLRHLVASGRELDPDFGQETIDLLLGLGTGGPKKADVIAALLREYSDFAAALPTGLTLILDDQHVIDGSPETLAILRGLVDRTGPDFSIVISSRAVPSLALGRLRSRGSLARIDGEDLCFDVAETDRLFREAYQHPLEPDIIEELIARTDGWAALLTLVRTGLEDKGTPDARALVAQLSATRGDLYDFLAEEVLASLSSALQHFLTRVSVLVSVDPETGSLVVDEPPDGVAVLIEESERLGLLNRPDRGAPHRFHPLVRDFLLHRLAAEIGTPAVRALHHRVAVALEGSNWFGSAWHYREAAEPLDAARVIDAAVPDILAAGAFELAAPFLDGSAGPADRPGALILRARLELERGGLQSATALGEMAVTSAAHGSRHGTALLNLAALHGMVGYEDESVALARRALAGPLSRTERLIGEAILAVRDISGTGDLELAASRIRLLGAEQKRDGQRRYAAISHLYLALMYEWLGRPADSLAAAIEAENELATTGSRGVELGAILAAKAMALALLNRTEEAERVIASAVELPGPLTRDEVAIESARLYSSLGDAGRAAAALASVDADALTGGYIGLHALTSGDLAARVGDIDAAKRWLNILDSHPCNDTSAQLRTELLRARIALREADPSVVGLAKDAHRTASLQHSRPGRVLADLIDALGGGAPLHHAVARIPPELSYCLSVLAEEIAPKIVELDPSALRAVTIEAERRPTRWTGPLHSVIAAGGGSATQCAAILAEVGGPEDAARLRAVAAKRAALRPAAVSISQRLAQPVVIEDLGRVHVVLGSNRLKILRRKVLALLCYLGSRPGMAATRDEVLDLLWPEMGPDAAGNSLHQTIYFLRRVFDPDYREGLSAGYVLYDGEVVSLNRELVSSRSRECWGLLSRSQASTDVVALLDQYTGRFALEFTYDDWASDYRDNLHAAVLAACEAAMTDAIGRGDFDSAIRIGHRVLALDSDADGVELTLLRAYKASGRHAAAAEQYAHYAAYLREDLGVEPPSYEEL